ncbi:MAG: alpha/beta fold hydrolase [Bacteroidetes bacterium]|nr:alpha/beta fold hydrolase [Bacteroidota bacterium]
MKWIKRLVIALFALYAIACGLLYFAQERLIFHPDKLPEDYTFDEGEELELPVADGISLNCLWLKEPESKGVILYLHGNRGSNRRCSHQAETMGGFGYDIFMPDYRGFGKSDGEIVSEEQLYGDAQQAYDFLKKHYPENRIVVAGYSIGTGMASYLAAKNHPQQLVLLAPYTSVVDLKNGMAPFLPDFLLKYPLRNIANLRQVMTPVTLFHGTFDEVISFESSVKLQALNPGRFRLIDLPEGHRGVIFSPVFRQTVGELLK